MNAHLGYLGDQHAQRLVPAETIVRLEKASKTFPGRDGQPVTALQDIDLTVPQGSILGVIGRSGAGKSTLIRLVNGLEKPSSGKVIVDGADIAALPEAALRHARRSIGMIFQHFNLLSSRTAAQNIALPLEVAGYDKAEIRTRVEELLALVGLTDKRNRYPSELSGGQKQRVGIARALATKPKVLLSDEATSALDPETTRSILDLLARINDELGLTILLITHEMAVIRNIAREVAVIEGGRIVEQGDVFEVFTRPHHEVTRSFLADESGRALPPYVAEQAHARGDARQPGGHPHRLPRSACDGPGPVAACTRSQHRDEHPFRFGGRDRRSPLRHPRGRRAGAIPRRHPRFPEQARSRYGGSRPCRLR